MWSHGRELPYQFHTSMYGVDKMDIDFDVVHFHRKTKNKELPLTQHSWSLYDIRWQRVDADRPCISERNAETTRAEYTEDECNMNQSQIPSSSQAHHKALESNFSHS